MTMTRTKYNKWLEECASESHEKNATPFESVVVKTTRSGKRYKFDDIQQNLKTIITTPRIKTDALLATATTTTIITSDEIVEQGRAQDNQQGDDDALATVVATIPTAVALPMGDAQQPSSLPHAKTRDDGIVAAITEVEDDVLTMDELDVAQDIIIVAKIKARVKEWEMIQNETGLYGLSRYEWDALLPDQDNNGVTNDDDDNHCGDATIRKMLNTISNYMDVMTMEHYSIQRAFRLGLYIIQLAKKHYTGIDDDDAVPSTFFTSAMCATTALALDVDNYREYPYFHNLASLFSEMDDDAKLPQRLKISLTRLCGDTPYRESIYTERGQFDIVNAIVDEITINIDNQRYVFYPVHGDWEHVEEGNVASIMRLYTANQKGSYHRITTYDDLELVKDGYHIFARIAEDGGSKVSTFQIDMANMEWRRQARVIQLLTLENHEELRMCPSLNGGLTFSTWLVRDGIFENWSITTTEVCEPIEVEQDVSRVCRQLQREFVEILHCRATTPFLVDILRTTMMCILNATQVNNDESDKVVVASKGTKRKACVMEENDAMMSCHHY